MDEDVERVEMYPGQKGFDHDPLSDEEWAIVYDGIKDQANRYRAAVFGKSGKEKRMDNITFIQISSCFNHKTQEVLLFGLTDKGKVYRWEYDLVGRGAEHWILMPVDPCDER
jgi:hypothetical protein